MISASAFALLINGPPAHLEESPRLGNVIRIFRLLPPWYCVQMTNSCIFHYQISRAFILEQCDVSIYECGDNFRGKTGLRAQSLRVDQNPTQNHKVQCPTQIPVMLSEKRFPGRFSADLVELSKILLSRYCAPFWGARGSRQKTTLARLILKTVTES